ncbi:uncharacterized protein CANTADRAFT_7768 [Suhomyces tanzawaensis NRRL Y-17324]|uniref:Hap4 transcription factor heteromerisation domain-containing protein n=1 Tax=Suhomyces tanzawaensis NRRL Y-17324 TaxID=984487 RepID=A0A1E4SCU3_9ASCO|nr:uncharacterized protein CANTADRAFT_7768 [Suhomyces tanzawaensis NRRL Y-17324]ODV77286.1 hypothetical protein CANTADRAFT_7768 [Suhomyces tanzawaensis NRRL Y-17324]
MSSPVEKPPDGVRMAIPEPPVPIKRESSELRMGQPARALDPSKGISQPAYPAAKPMRATTATNAKYAKIQPAIAPKPMGAVPKPKTFSPVAILKNGKPAPSPKPDVNLNINTSKRWVLPPRPRPGRKPTLANEEDPKKQPLKVATSTSVVASDLGRISPKKRAKVCKKEDEGPTLVKPDDPGLMASVVASETLASSLSVPPSRTLSTTSAALPPPPPPVLKTDPKTELNDLKLTYLNKLKEQELIRNYMEVITNQIKELNFVQSGVITFDALKTNRIKKANGSSVSVSTPLAKTTNYDQLESINNLNDLNKFLGYLTRSSNIIHSATKQTNKSEDADSILNQQIHHYLNVRSQFKSMQMEETKKLHSLKEQTQIKKKPVLLGIDKSAVETKPSSILSNSSLSKNAFSPDLLGMRGTNLFDETDNDLLIDLVNDDFNRESHDLILDEFLDSAKVDLDQSRLEIEEQQLGNVKIYDKNEAPPKVIKKKLKLNCGFCTNDTPCLCLDAEIDMGLLK